MNQNDELVSKLTELLRQASSQSAPGGWPPAQQPTQFGAPVQPIGLLVPVTIPTQAGDVSCYVQLPAQSAANPPAAIAALQAAGWPIRVYSGGNGGGWQNRRQRQWGRRW